MCYTELQLMKRSQKGFAPIIIVFLVAISLVVFFVFKYQSNHLSTNQKNPQESSSKDTYKSLLGFSFTKPSTGTVEETSLDTNHLDTAIQDGSLVEPKQVETTSASVGTIINTDAYRLYVTKVKDVGSVGPEITDKLAYGGGPFFQFLTKDKTFYNNIRGLIDKKIDPKDSPFFRDSGQDKRFNVISYVNSESNLSGIKSLVISGFELPGLDIGTEYYLLDANQRYIIFIYSRFSCPKKDQLEEKYKIYNSDGSYTIDPNFDGTKGNEYVKALHDLAPECENTSKYKNDLDSLLNSLKFTQ